MRDTNPFEQLGLNRDVVAFLAERGQLEDYVRDVYRATITRVHPDKGGNDELAKLVNEAFGAIRDKPENIPSWLAGMNGSPKATSGYSSKPEVRTPPRPESGSETESIGKYTLIKSPTYALGMEELRNAGKTPFSFADNLRARLEQPDLFDTWLDSDTGIVYKAGSSKIKIIPACDYLRHIPADFISAFIPVDYSKLKGTELDTKKMKVNKSLTKSEILSHPGWLALVGGDADLLRRYTHDAFARYAKKYRESDRMMGFNVVENHTQNQLRAAGVNILNSNSYAYGINNLSNSGRFLSR